MFFLDNEDILLLIIFQKKQNMEIKIMVINKSALKKIESCAAINRRTLFQSLAATVLFSTVSVRKAVSQTNLENIERVAKNGRINHSVSKWCYSNGDNKLSLEELCIACTKMGIKSIELLVPDELPTIKKHGLTCAIVSSHGIT